MAISPSVVGPNVLSSTPAANLLTDGKAFALGDLFDAGGDGGTWIYCVAATAMAIGSVVSVDSGATATKITKAIADTGTQVAVCPIVTASGDYFWAQRSGVVANILVLASCAADVALYTCATGGSLDDDSTSQTRALGIKLTSARGGTAGVAPGYIYSATSYT